MYVCMYVCMYVYVCVYIYIYIYMSEALGMRREGRDRRATASTARLLCPIRLPMLPLVMLTLLDLCVSSLRRGHANLLCIVPISMDDPRRESFLQ